jgi:hypothetical protein
MYRQVEDSVVGHPAKKKLKLLVWNSNSGGELVVVFTEHRLQCNILGVVFCEVTGLKLRAAH